MKIKTRNRVITLDPPPSPPLQSALAKFEQQFTYPLGAGGSFSVEHGLDYSGFCRAMGAARSFIVENDNQVKAVIGTSIRTMVTPEGELQAAYICDLKTSPEANCGRALLSCMHSALAWCKPQAQAAYGVVMDGTAANPAIYSGRLGIPHFTAAGKVAVLQIALRAPNTGSACKPEVEIVSEAAARAQFARLAGGFHCPSGSPQERSQISPLWLATTGASGCLEDTRKVKRLVKNDGSEIVAAHLSNFAYSDVNAAALMINSAATLAALQHFQCLFVSFPWQDCQSIVQALPALNMLVASATVYAHALTAGNPWFVHSSEI